MESDPLPNIPITEYQFQIKPEIPLPEGYSIYLDEERPTAFCGYNEDESIYFIVFEGEGVIRIYPELGAVLITNMPGKVKIKMNDRLYGKYSNDGNIIIAVGERGSRAIRLKDADGQKGVLFLRITN